MAIAFVSATFAVANPSLADMEAIRAAHIARLDHEMAQAKISRRCEEIGMSAQMSTVGMYLAAHGFGAEQSEAERWFVMDFAAYRKLSVFNDDADAERALFGGRWPLLARQAAVATEPMRLAA